MQKMRVLVVDNQARARHSLKALLDAWHEVEEVREAANGREALQAAEEFHPDVILMDARMPKMNGIEATRLIKTSRPQITIIVLSMFPEFKAEALAAGADAFVSKGDVPGKLREALTGIIENR